MLVPGFLAGKNTLNEFKAYLCNPAHRLPLAGLLLMCLFSVLQFLLQGSVGILASELKSSFLIDATAISILSSSFYYSYILMQIPAGLLYDRFGIRKVSAIAVSLLALGCVALALAPNLTFAIFSRILMGIGCSCGFVGLLFAIQKWYPARQFAFIAAITECACMLGVGAANSALSHLFTAFGWRIAVAACAVTGVLLVLVMLRVFPLEGEHPPSEGDSGSGPGFKALFLTIRKVIRIPEVWLGGIFAACCYSVISAFVTLWAIPYFVKGFSLDVIEATSLASVVYIGIAVSSPLLGWLARYVSLVSMMSVGAGLSTLLMILLLAINTTNINFLYGLTFVLGFCCSVYQLPFTLVSRVCPKAMQGAALGATNMITMLAAPLLQPIVGIIISLSEGSGVLDGYEVYDTLAYQKGLSIIPICLMIAFGVSFYLKDEGAVNLKGHMKQLLAGKEKNAASTNKSTLS